MVVSGRVFLTVMNKRMVLTESSARVALMVMSKKMVLMRWLMIIG